DSFANLTAGMSLEVPGRRLIEPGDPSRSFLYEKINCSSPQVGTRMRPADPMRVEEQALIRDWITQGALEMPGPPPIVDAGIRDTGLTDSGQQINDDGGVPIVDAGGGGPSERPERGELRGACGCREAGPGGMEGLLVVFALLALLGARVVASARS